MYRVSETVRSSHNPDGAIVLDVQQGQMFNLNFVGSRILELLKSGSTESEIVDEIGGSSAWAGSLRRTMCGNFSRT